MLHVEHVVYFFNISSNSEAFVKEMLPSSSLDHKQIICFDLTGYCFLFKIVFFSFPINLSF